MTHCVCAPKDPIRPRSQAHPAGLPGAALAARTSLALCLALVACLAGPPLARAENLDPRQTDTGTPEVTRDPGSPARPAPGAPKSERAAPAMGANPAFTIAREVQQQLNDRYRGEDSKMAITLLIVGKKGDTRTNQLLRYRKKEDGLLKTIFWYDAPADVRGTATLSLEVRGSDDLQRLYLPAMKKDRRIAAPDKGKSWMGTDFSYEDLQEKKVDDWEYGPLKIERVEGVECYSWVMTPKTPDKSSYGRLETWLRKDILELVKRRYYDRKGQALKELIPRHYRRFSDPTLSREVWLSTYMEMTSLESGQQSVLKIERVLFNNGLGNDLFSPRAMTTIPERFPGGEVSRATPLPDPFAASRPVGIR